MRIALQQAEASGKRLDRDAQGGGGYRARGYELGVECQVGIRIERHLDSRADGERDTVGFSQDGVHNHLRRIENPNQRLAGEELIALLRLAQGVIAPDAFERHHAGQRRTHHQPFGVAERAVETHLLAVALELEDFESGRFGDVMLVMRFLQAVDLRLRVFRFGLTLQPVDLAQQRTAAKLQLGLSRDRLRLFAGRIAAFRRCC